jgi:succinyl-diaminopimelate desuccinylase
LIVAEPTANRAYLGHKGVLWLRLRLAGVAAHGSMPELGVNAVVKAAETTVALAALDFGSDEPHQLLGRSSVNVGFSRGGFNFNTVPSLAEIGVDLRISPPRESASLIEHIRTRLAHDVEIEEVLNLAPVDTESSNPWIQAIGDAAGRTAEQGVPAGGLPYFTDAAVLAGPLDSPPVVIIGPGDPELAHVANESCDIEEIRHAAELYFNIMQLPEPAALLSAGPEGFLIGSARSDLK